jgi:DNA polymerase elongation subunit (family B)
MRALLIDCYRAGDKLVLWLKAEDNFRFELSYSTSIFIERCELSIAFLKKYSLRLQEVEKKKYTGEKTIVFEFPIKNISRYELIVRWIEKETNYRVNLYNADIAPEQMLLYERGIAPFDVIETANLRPIKADVDPGLSKTVIEIAGVKKITEINMDGILFTGEEHSLLTKFSESFTQKDPDVILMEGAFSKLPFLYERLRQNNIACHLNRWDDKPINYKGGKSFFSYGRVLYRDYAVRLNGRFLIDSGSAVASECDVDGIAEISRLCGSRFQQIASRSFGAAFQAALVREIIQSKTLVPFKENPVDPPISLLDMIKLDRVGHRFDSLTGMHKDVAEIDFSSLFPWLIYNYNISPENFDISNNATSHFEQVPGLPIRISLKKKGLVPRAIKKILDRRMFYKKNPTSVNRSRIQGLKWVLVTSYGYLRFREFKLGLATSHMAIGSYAREILMQAKELCESRGFEVVHGIVDSLYIKKKGMAEDDVKNICSELEAITGVPVSFEGIFKWIVFLPSINDIKRPVPTKYFGLFENGELKFRGIEARQQGVPGIVKDFQLIALKEMAKEENPKDAFERSCQLLKELLKNIKHVGPYDLCCMVRISKTDYKQDNAQSKALKQLKAKGLELRPGMPVRFVYAKRGVVLPEYYDGRPDTDKYRTLLVRSLFSIYQTFYTREDIHERIADERQTRVWEYGQAHLCAEEQGIQVEQEAF